MLISGRFVWNKSAVFLSLSPFFYLSPLENFFEASIRILPHCRSIYECVCLQDTRCARICSQKREWKAWNYRTVTCHLFGHTDPFVARYLPSLFIIEMSNTDKKIRQDTDVFLSLLMKKLIFIYVNDVSQGFTFQPNPWHRTQHFPRLEIPQHAVSCYYYDS